MVDSLHGIIPLIPCASYLISPGSPYLSIMEFFINVQAVSIYIWWSIIENLLIYGLNQQKLNVVL